MQPGRDTGESRVDGKSPEEVAVPTRRAGDWLRPVWVLIRTQFLSP